MPIVQDDGGHFWSLFGAQGYSLVIIDGAGMLVHKITYATFPGSEAEIEGVVDGLLAE